MADYQQNFLASLGAGYNFGQQIKQQQDTSKLNQLASQAYSAPPDQRDSILSQTAAVDAGAAQGLEKQMAYSDERRNANMVNMAKLLTNAPPQARAGLYRSMVPTLSRFGLSEMPQEYNDQTAPIIDKAAQSIVQAYQGANATPTDVRSFQMMTAGLSPEDQMRARRINLGLDGRESSAAISYQKVKGADGIERLVAVDPRQIGAQVVGDGAGYGSFAGPVANGPPIDGGGLDFANDAQQFASLGIPVSSTLRSGKRNSEVGGVANSYHLTGEAMDIVPQSAQQKQQAQQYWRSRGYQVIDEGDHLHVEPPRRGMTTSRLQSGANPFAGRRPEDEAAATERAKLQAQQDFLPTELGMRTDADIAKARGVEQAKSEQERASNERAKTAQLNNVDRGLTRIDAALKALSGRLVDTGPIDGRLMVSTPQGQELEAAVGAIQNDMLALTRVPGIGSQSDLEAKIANLKYPSIYNHPSVNAANVQQLKAFMGDLRNQITGSAAQGGRTVVRTGTSNGRKVIQYSDGSVEYGN